MNEIRRQEGVRAGNWRCPGAQEDFFSFVGAVSRSLSPAREILLTASPRLRFAAEGLVDGIDERLPEGRRVS